MPGADKTRLEQEIKTLQQRILTLETELKDGWVPDISTKNLVVDQKIVENRLTIFRGAWLKLTLTLTLTLPY
jgi:hypothetical protein